jgi:uncharacterized protein YjiS (DUF1127 family)
MSTASLFRNSINMPVTRRPNEKPSGRAGALERFIGWMVRVSDHSQGAQSAREFQALSRMSDADLAKRGLKRAELPQHVFGKYYYS